MENRKEIYDSYIYGVSCSCGVERSEISKNSNLAVYPFWFRGSRKKSYMDGDRMGRGADGPDSRCAAFINYQMQQRSGRGGRRTFLPCIRCVFGVLEYNRAVALRFDVLQHLLHGNDSVGHYYRGRCEKMETSVSTLFTACMDTYGVSVNDKSKNTTEA